MHGVICVKRSWRSLTLKKWVHLRNFNIPIQKVRHSRLADDLEKASISVSVQGRLSQDDSLESCYLPIIQSGRDCKLKFSAENTDKFVHYGSIVSTVGVRYFVSFGALSSFFASSLIVQMSGVQ